WTLIRSESVFRNQRVKRRDGCIIQPLNVVTVIIGVLTDWGGLREWTIIDDGHYLRIVCEKEVIEQVRQRRFGVAETLQQGSRLSLQSARLQGGEEDGAQREQVQHVVNLSQTLRVTREIFDRRRSQRQNIEQQLMRIAGLADERGALAHRGPIGIDLSKQG